MTELVAKLIVLQILAGSPADALTLDLALTKDASRIDSISAEQSTRDIFQNGQ